METGRAVDAVRATAEPPLAEVMTQGWSGATVRASVTSVGGRVNLGAEPMLCPVTPQERAQARVTRATAWLVPMELALKRAAADLTILPQSALAHCRTPVHHRQSTRRSTADDAPGILEKEHEVHRVTG